MSRFGGFELLAAAQQELCRSFQRNSSSIHLRFPSVNLLIVLRCSLSCRILQRHLSFAIYTTAGSGHFFSLYRKRRQRCSRRRPSSRGKLGDQLPSSRKQEALVRPLIIASKSARVIEQNGKEFSVRICFLCCCFALISSLVCFLRLLLKMSMNQEPKVSQTQTQTKNAALYLVVRREMGRKAVV